jgi:site-specific DNA-methyltransferase (adenine-specific)
LVCGGLFNLCGDILIDKYVNKIIQGPALSVLKTLPDKSIDMCLTSPPYWRLRDYKIKGQLGLESTFQEYINKLCNIFDEVKRVLKKEGTCWVNLGDTYGGSSGGYHPHPNELRANKHQVARKSIGFDKHLLQIPGRFSIEMCNRGWILRNEIIWHKPNSMPVSANDRFTVDFEKMFFFTKNKKYYFEQQLEKAKMNRWGGNKFQLKSDYKYKNKAAVRIRNRKNMMPEKRNKRCVWTINTEPYSDAHFAVYPEELCQTPIIAGCPKDGVVIDPFSGSGTTALVALKLGRKFIGIELNPEYIKIAKKRIWQEKNQMKLF